MAGVFCYFRELCRSIKDAKSSRAVHWSSKASVVLACTETNKLQENEIFLEAW
jgi:hypothetical protein